MTKWLSEDEQVQWRAYFTATELVRNALNQDLMDKQGLSFAEYEILVRLSEAPDQTLRMSELADKTLSSRSRLSHQVSRLEDRGWVQRSPCAEDGRGLNATLTEAGMAKLVKAAPDHVEGVRQLLLEPLTDAEYESLGRACQKIAAAIDPTGDRWA